MDTFDKEKAERRKARQAKIDSQMKAMESAMENADHSYRNFMWNLEGAEASISSGIGKGEGGGNNTSTVASGDEYASGTSSHDRRRTAMEMARNFLDDEDDSAGRSVSSSSLFSDPEFAHADAGGRPGSVQGGHGTMPGYNDGGVHHANGPNEKLQPLNTLMGRVGVSLKSAVGGVKGNNALMGREGESLKSVVGGVKGRMGRQHREHEEDAFNQSDRSFRADNLHNLSAGLDNYNDSNSSSQDAQFTNRTRGDRRTSHLRDDDGEDTSIFEKLEWTCIKLSNRFETVCFHRRCLIVMAAATAAVALIVAAFATTSAFSGHLPSFNFGGESEANNERYVKIRDRILFAEVSEPATLEFNNGNGGTSGTPQSFALEWIARHDPMVVDPEDPYLLQRYALAVFWFQLRTDKKGEPTDEKQWKDETNWMSEKGYCAWHGVQCYPRDGMQKDKVYDGNNIIIGLNLTKNELQSDSMPKEIYTTLQGLQTLDISHNKLGGTIATEIGKLAALEGLFIGDNSFKGQLPTEIGKLSNLMNFYAHNCLFSGSIPEEIGDLLNLYALGLHSNDLSGGIPSSLGRCTKLRNLYLDQNQIEGKIPEEIYSLTRLADLRLRSNKLKGSISEKVGNLANLELLYLDGNELTSSIPRGIGALGARLEELHLQDNELEGGLEVEIGRLSRLKELYLSSNRLTSTIPIEWGELKDLKQLFLAENLISGTIPIEIVGMEFLVALQLQSNNLQETIPTELGTMFRLEYLHMENNKLQGTVPTQLGQLIHLEKLTLHGNGLGGQVPNEVCELISVNNLAELVTDCAGNSAAIKCDCCTKCV